MTSPPMNHQHRALTRAADALGGRSSHWLEPTLADVGDDSVRREIDESSGGVTEAMLRQHQVASMVPAEVMEKQIRRREETEDEGYHNEGDDNGEGNNRQRRPHQEPDKHDGGHLGGAERTRRGNGCL